MASTCYLQPDVIDPRNNTDIHMVSEILEKKYPISKIYSQSILACMKNNQYSQKRTTAVKTVKSPFCQFNKRLVDPFRIKKGAEFYIKNHAYLVDANYLYHVDPYIITAIIGVESNYGRYTGKNLTKDALATVIANTQSSATINASEVNDDGLHFTNPNKKQFFIDELVALVSMKIENNLDIDHMLGSWDGGIGLPQFMPTSYQKHAVSPKNRFPDLFDPEDAIHSVANYLVARGNWQPGPIATTFQPSQAIEQQFTGGSTQKIKSPDHKGKEIYRFMLDDDSFQYWITYNNFDAIRTYNSRPHYVINVMLLSEEIHDYIKSHHPEYL